MRKSKRSYPETLAVRWSDALFKRCPSQAMPPQADALSSLRCVFYVTCSSCHSVTYVNSGAYVNSVTHVAVTYDDSITYVNSVTYAYFRWKWKSCVFW